MRPFKSQRGTILLVTMLFAGAIGIFLACYLNLSLTTLQMANRSFFSNAAVDLVDASIDQAMWNINDNSDKWTTPAAGSWTKTTPTGFTQYTKSLNYTLSNGAAGKVNVWVNEPADGSNYQVVAQATVTLPTALVAAGMITKEAEVYVTPPSYNKIPPNAFANGLVAEGAINLSGTTSLDSWDSSVNDNGLTAPVPYYDSGSYKNKTDQGKVMGSIGANITSGGSANIYGYVSVGASDSVTATGSAMIGSFTDGKGIDPLYVSHNFTASMPDITAPAVPDGTATFDYVNVINDSTTSPTIAGVSSLTTAITLPLADSSGTITDTAAGSVDVTTTDSSGSTTTNTYTTYFYKVPNIGIGSGGIITVRPYTNVVFLVQNTQSSGASVDVGSKGSIAIPSSGSVTIYTPGDVNLSGGGVTNGVSGSKSPSDMYSTQDFQLYGTRKSSDVASMGYQNFSIDGSNGFSGAVYGPNTDTTFLGTGDVCGAVVCHTAYLSGTSNFHYDMALVKPSAKSTIVYPAALSGTLTKYRELEYAADQAPYATDLNF
jgi:hypothetical protein